MYIFPIKVNNKLKTILGADRLKKIKILSMFLILILLGACSTGPKEISVGSLEIPILDSMNLEDVVNNEIDGVNVEGSSYSVEDGQLDTFLQEYEQVLNEDGWVTTSNMQPNGLKIEKKDQEVTILVYERENQLFIDLIPVI